MHWAPPDNMGVDRPNGTRPLRLAISAVKSMFEQDDNDIDVEAHYYPRKRFLAMAYIGVIYPMGTPSTQYDPCKRVFHEEHAIQ